MQYHWKKLTKEQVALFFDKIDVEEFKQLFRPDSNIEVLRAELPFYNRFSLYRFTTFASMPSLSLEFLGDGENFYYLDGAPDPLYHVNTSESLHLTQNTVLDYLLFFFDKVEGADGDIYLIEDPENSPFMTSVSQEFKKHVAEQYKGFQLQFERDSNNFIIKAPTFFEGSMVEASIAIQPNGNMQLLEHKMLFSLMESFIERPNEIYT